MCLPSLLSRNFPKHIDTPFPGIKNISNSNTQPPILQQKSYDNSSKLLPPSSNTVKNNYNFGFDNSKDTPVNLNVNTSVERKNTEFKFSNPSPPKVTSPAKKVTQPFKPLSVEDGCKLTPGELKTYLKNVDKHFDTPVFSASKTNVVVIEDDEDDDDVIMKSKDKQEIVGKDELKKFGSNKKRSNTPIIIDEEVPGH